MKINIKMYALGISLANKVHKKIEMIVEHHITIIYTSSCNIYLAGMPATYMYVFVTNISTSLRFFLLLHGTTCNSTISIEYTMIVN